MIRTNKMGEQVAIPLAKRPITPVQRRIEQARDVVPAEDYAAMLSEASKATS